MGVRRIFHELRSRAIENFNGQFKSIFDGGGQVPTKGLANTARFALGAVLVYQIALLHQYEHGRDLRVGLSKPSSKQHENYDRASSSSTPLGPKGSISSYNSWPISMAIRGEPGSPPL